MRLVFKSEIDSLNNISFSGETIVVGHERQECKLCFDHNRWPMVGRLHAEFRNVNGVCHLFDLNSGFGTYVHGKRIIHSSPIRIGSRIQFGPDGPELLVAHVELVDSMPGQHASGSPDQPRLVSSQPEAPGIGFGPAAKDDYTSVTPASLEVVGDQPVNVKRLKLTKEVVRVGRAPELDMVFDVGACFISRTHAEIRSSSKGYILTDLNSFNGTLLNGQRITGPSFLRNGDTIQLGIRGPVLGFHQADPRLATPSPLAPQEQSDLTALPTASRREGAPIMQQAETSNREPTYVLPLDGRSNYVVGRARDSDVKLDGLQISKKHATLTVVGTQISVEDNHSTNGVYVNGSRLRDRMTLGSEDVVQIGPFRIRVDLGRGIEVYDTRAQMRIDSVSITKVVPSKVGAGRIKLLDDISLTISPNQFVGLLGPSGAGKSTFIDALNGTRPATAGQVLINNSDLYQNLSWLKQFIGYVPQEDIIHRELTVYRTLYFVARLRLSEDVSKAEIERIITEVLDVTGLTQRRDVPVARLSGGQRKRVAVAVELLTQPSIIFLDEPTSGLDPMTEEKIMLLFRQLADSGHTIVLTTHAMENVRLFDKIVVLMQGKLVFYGTPSEAVKHLNATSLKDLYDKLEEPIAAQMSTLPPLVADDTHEQQHQRDLRLSQIRENVAETWKLHFQETVLYEQNVSLPQGNLSRIKPEPASSNQRTSFKKSFAQWRLLSERYGEILTRDKFHLMILFGQAPVIACLTWLAVSADSPRDFPYLVLSLVPVWFGASVAAREIIRDRAIYNRERMVNLGILPYIGSKVSVLSLMVGVQCLLLLGTFKAFTLLGWFKLPTLFGGFPQLLIMILTGMVGISLGLLVSASVKTSEVAASLVPLLLIVQIMFCGFVGVPIGTAKVVGALMPATWSFDEMKRLSGTEVNVLRGKDEGAEPAYNNDGRGLFKQMRYQNERALEEREHHTTGQEDKFSKSRQESEDTQKATAVDGRQGRELNAVEFVPSPTKTGGGVGLADDLSDYVDFLHPWGTVGLNPVILLIMFFSFVAATIGVLRAWERFVR